MPDNKKTIFALLSFFALVFLLFFFGREKAVAPTQVDDFSQSLLEKEEDLDDFAIEEIPQKISISNDLSEIDITYPFLQGKEDFNSLSESIAYSHKQNFEESYLQNETARKESQGEDSQNFAPRYYLKIDYDKGILNENYVSFIFKIDFYLGGAHGMRIFESLNYDLKKDSALKLEDLFEGQDDFLNKISQHCLAEIKKKILAMEDDFYSEEMIFQEGLLPKEENFAKFIFDQDSITFYFEPYQVAAYVLGDFQVKMPLK